MTTKDEALRVVREALERAESATNYTQATVSPGNQRDRKGEWVEVHGGRAESSYRQLQLAIGATRSALRTIALAVEAPSNAVQSVALICSCADQLDCDLSCQPLASASASGAVGETAPALARIDESKLPTRPAGPGRKRLCRDCADFAQDGICPNDGKPCSTSGLPGTSNGQEN